MNSITICSFPTKIFIVDDNESFLENLKLILDSNKCSYLFCVNPYDVASLIDKQKQYPSFLDKTTSIEVSDDDSLSIDLNIRDIHKEIYSINRFNQVSAIITDYDMPGMNGLDLCRQAKSKILTRALFTGVADESTAIDAFNKCYIEQYIRKQDKNVIENIKQLINKSKELYFNNLSKNYVNLLHSNDGNLSILLDNMFIDFFFTLIEQEKIIEYYLLDSNGSFLMLKSNGEVTALYITNAVSHKSLIDSAKYEGYPGHILNELEKYSKTLWFYDYLSENAHSLYNSEEYLEKYLFPISPLTCQNKTIYYSYIKAVPFINKEKVISFDTYKNNFL